MVDAYAISVSSEPNKVCDWVDSIREKQSSVHITRTPEHIRSRSEEHKKYFAPVLVSLGPYRYSKNPNLNNMDKYKLCAVRRFTNSSDNDYANAEPYLERIRHVTTEAKKWYDDIPSEIDDDTFTWIMFMDGCFILEFISQYVSTSSSKDDGWLRKHDINLVAREIMLLENQIPIIVLKELMCIKDSMTVGTTENFMLAIECFICRLLHREEPKQNQSGAVNVQSGQCVHLLDLCRRKFLGATQPQSCCSKKEPQFFRSIKELKEAGIWFRRSTENFSVMIDFKEKAFPLFGELHLSPIMVDDMTKYLFHNMIAYESGMTSTSGYDVISYFCFMDSLIDSEEDVKILRSKKILHNGLSSDQEVAGLFNVLASDLSPKQDAYASVKEKIQSHCDSIWSKWLTSLYYTHFHSPWSFIAFISGVFLLVLTALQTFYGHRQVFPPKD